MGLEHKTAFRVNSFYDPAECEVIEKDGKIFIFSEIYEGEPGDWYSPSDDDHFFETKKEADEYLSSIIPFTNATSLKNYIKFRYENDDQSELSEIFPDSLIKKICDKPLLDFSFEERRQVALALRGILNIGGASFRVSDVDCIKHGKECLSIVLKNGKEIVTRYQAELFIIESIFGNNYSNIVFSNITTS